MKCCTSRYVVGSDFFGRETELQILEKRVRQGNHLSLTGQHRIGKTSAARELGRRLEEEGWILLYADVEGSKCPEDAIIEIAQAAYSVRGGRLRRLASLARRFRGQSDGTSLESYRIKLRSGVDAGNWHAYGEDLLGECSELERPVLMVIDHLPIFLKQMLNEDGHARRVDDFLSWMRKAFEQLDNRFPVVVVSGSIGLEPLVNRLGLSARINYLHSIRLEPWNCATSIQCIERLAESSGLEIEAGIARAVYDKLGIGNPYHVQVFFARLEELAIKRGQDRVSLNDVSLVYRQGLRGMPLGLNEFQHHGRRIKEQMADDDAFLISVEILAEAATQGAFTPASRRCLESLYSDFLVEKPIDFIHNILEILEYDGCLVSTDGNYRFQSNLLKDFWDAQFGAHHIPLDRFHPFAWF